jgi:hypothetical protein
MNPDAIAPDERFSLVAGGPFHALLGRCGLLGVDGLPSITASLMLPLLAWFIPTVLASAQSLLDPEYYGWSVYTDTTVYARYLVAMWAMIATERFADSRVTMIARHFRGAQLLGQKGLGEFQNILKTVDRRSSSATAEAVILLLAIVASFSTTEYVNAISQNSWESMPGEFSEGLSWAGWGTALVSNPLFLFLVFRWLWRFMLWANLLRQVARLPLQLMPMHPDRTGGLGFVAIFPGVFSGYLFALSCVVASSFIKAMTLVHYTENAVWLAVFVWFSGVLLIFLAPLLVFVPPLYRAREQGLLNYGRLAQRHHLRFHQRWIEQDPGDRELLGSADPSSVSDLNASVHSVLEMRLFPVDRPAVVQLLLAAGIPMLFVAVAQVPLGTLLQLAAGILL